MTTPHHSSARRSLGFVAAGILAIVLLLLWARRERPAAPSPGPAPDVASAPRSSRPPWAVYAPPAVQALADSHEPDRAKVGLWMLEDPNLPMVAADSLIAWRFPRGSHPLKAGMVDVLEPNRRNDTKQPAHMKNGTLDPSLQVLFSGDKFALYGDEPVHVSLTVTKDDAPVAISILGARALAVEPNSHKPLGPQAPFTMTESSPHVFSGTFSTAGTPLAQQGGFIDLEVTFDAGDGKQGVAMLDMFYQDDAQAPARFSGDVRDVLGDGSLTFYVGVDVMDAGLYAIDANVFDGKGEPVAMLTARLELAHGHQEVPMTMYGRIVREQHAAGPFKLQNLRGSLTLIGQDPDRKLMPNGPDYQTRAYAENDFTDAEYWDAQKEQRIRNLIDLSHGGGPNLLRQTVTQAQGEGWVPKW